MNHKNNVHCTENKINLKCQENYKNCLIKSIKNCKAECDINILNIQN